ncbi:MAG: sulfite exporter TauE/SafE family protein [Candidatus Peribacteraceae bacterium]|nr:sulfite exporter TauE/SafE family protein [Candidatus Peribacteraceae bacterium]
MSFFALPLLIVGGFIGGFFGSAVGSAGLVSLPILLLLGLSPHAAIGTTRPAAIVLELISAIRYRRERVLTTPLLKRGILLGCCAAVGSTVGAIVSADLSDQALRLLLAMIILTTTIFLFMKKQWGLQEHPARQRHIVLLAVTAMFSGLYAGLFGFTFGTLIILVLVAFGYTLLQSSAMGKVVGAISSTASGLIFFYHGFIQWDYAIALSIGFGIGAWVGTRVAAKAGNRYVKILLMVVVVASVGKLLFDYITYL